MSFPTLLLLTLVVAAATATAHTCVHDSTEIQEMIAVDEDKRATLGYHRFHTLAVGQMRIKVLTPDIDDTSRYCTAAGQKRPTYSSTGNTFTCTADDVLTATKKRYLLNNILPAVVSRLESVLQVQRVSGNLFVPRSACAPYSIADSLRVGQTGIPEADYALFISAAATSGATLAWAGLCAKDQNGRPIVGRANFAPKHIEWGNEASREKQLNAAVHELIHALGFTKSEFPSQFVNTTTLRGKQATIYSIPPVMAAFREQISCPTSPGAELEDEGSAGSVGSHWDRRVLKDEIMTAAGGSILSNMTLSALEATGWYTVDYSKAEVHGWGKDAGCSFQNDLCNTTAGGLGTYFCNDMEHRHACTWNSQSIGYCSVVKWSADLPTYFQYFSDPTLGGDMFMDNCPEVVAYANRDCTATDYARTSWDDILGNYYGAGGRCVNTVGPLIQATSSQQGNTQRCLQFRCPCPGNRLQFKVNSSEWIDCPMSGIAGDVAVPTSTGYRGSVQCPAAHDFCDDELSDCTPAPRSTPTQETPVPATHNATPAPTLVPETPAPTIATPAPISITIPAPLPGCDNSDDCSNHATGVSASTTVDGACDCACRNEWTGLHCQTCIAKFNASADCGQCSSGFGNYPSCDCSNHVAGDVDFTGLALAGRDTELDFLQSVIKDLNAYVATKCGAVVTSDTTTGYVFRFVTGDDGKTAVVSFDVETLDGDCTEADEVSACVLQILSDGCFPLTATNENGGTAFCTPDNLRQSRDCPCGSYGCAAAEEELVGGLAPSEKPIHVGGDGDNGTPFWIWIVVVAGVLLFIVFIVALARHHPGRSTKRFDLDADEENLNATSVIFDEVLVAGKQEEMATKANRDGGEAPGTMIQHSAAPTVNCAFSDI